MFTLKARRLLTFLSVSLVCPDLAPEGKYVHYSISGPTTQIGHWNLGNEINLHIQDLKDNLPNFNKYGEILHVGCYWGKLPTVSNTPVVGYNNIPQKTPVENLYNVGDVKQVKPGDEVFIVWNPSLMKAGIFYHQQFQAIIDFKKQRACCRTGFPPPNKRWCKSSHEWDEMLVTGLEP